MKRLTAGLAACVLVSTMAIAAHAQEKEKVTFATASGSVAYVTYYITKEMGYFDDAGIDAEMIVAGSGAKAMAAAVGGNVDVIMPSPGEIIKAREKGIDLVLFGAVATQLGTSVVFSKDWAASHGLTEESTLEERMAALKDVRLAISSPGSLTDAVVRYFAGRAGLDPDRDMTLVGIPNQSNAMMIAMEQGRVDGFVIAPPDTVIAAHDLGAFIAFDMAAGKVPDLAGFFHIGLGSSEEFAASEKAVKVAQAFQKTLDALNDPELSDTVRDRVRAAYYPRVDPEIFAEVWRNVVLAAPATLEINDAMFDKVVVLERIVTPGFDASMIEGSYTNVAAEQVAP